ncbi:hypothetical protein Micbo1qcDRAFT_203867 [Microdochium bolleyi]|uniref:Uncharacterized protein n=1 Tax=Microdochium bolleyi TaxID=196109 RepID=A0A136J4D2_9PEZI|nr:hypothetical protein Micbo1qcDRAFT_203867 [Microdochium bolleyi]
MAELSSNEDFQVVLARLKYLEDRNGDVDNSQARQLLNGFSYALEQQQDGAMLKYGIVPTEDDRHGPLVDPVTFLSGTKAKASGRARKAVPFFALTVLGRIIILLVLLGMFTLIVSYWALSPDTALGVWMSSETVGVRILIVTVGMTITLFWSSYFYCKSTASSSHRAPTARANIYALSGITFMTPYRILATDPSRTRDAINMSLSTNAFSGLARSVSFWQGTHDWYLASVAAVALFAEFLPALLANVPYRMVHTSETHAACVFLAATIIGLMIIVTCASFLIEWPHMPADPSTLAGAMYYISAARNNAGNNIGGGGFVSGTPEAEERGTTAAASAAAPQLPHIVAGESALPRPTTSDTSPGAGGQQPEHAQIPATDHEDGGNSRQPIAPSYYGTVPVQQYQQQQDQQPLHQPPPPSQQQPHDRPQPPSAMYHYE